MKTKWFMVMMTTVALAGNAMAISWTGAGDNDLWSNGANWDTGAAPGYSEASIAIGAGNDAGNDLVVIDASTNVVVNSEIFGPEWGMTLEINGGSLTQVHTADPWNGFVFAPVADAGAHSVINVLNGGAMTVQEMLLGDNWWFAGHYYVDLNVYDTSVVTANGWCWLGGTINLYGGIVDIAGSMNFAMGNGYAGINIEDGTLIVRGSEFTAATAQEWEDGGYLKGFGGAGDVLIDDSTGDVVITAVIPEPATMVLLGLGGLMLRKRK